MNESSHYESLPPIDYLSESVSVGFSIEREAIEHLPEISAEELGTKKEKYRILLGKAERYGGDSVEISIKGIFEGEAGHGYYEEGVEVVEDINFQRIKDEVAHIRESVPEYKDFEFIGDIHTHPVKQSELPEDVSPLSPSEEDLRSIIAEYEKGVLTSDMPFIFGIAAPDESGNTEYAFYRMVKSNGEYRCIEVQ